MRAARFTNHSRPGMCYTSNRAFLENSDDGGGKFSVKRPSEHRPVMLVWSTTGGRRGLHTPWPPFAENVTTHCGTTTVGDLPFPSSILLSTSTGIST